ncbi:MAG: single-stranded-DNA-specific exonuclease RecJ [Acidobacteria bacterium]|nr:MAG: single-stranded-DNA-specific exonuclease RecJ [Acidobacteriota bacterium]PYS80858.1 MAG: single-stranded-DNA-specific exonuclease RecJ [Acidobacteriota bacterium]
MTMKTASETRSGARRWVLRRDAEGRAPAFARALVVSSAVAGVLAARGVSSEDSARALLRPSLGQLHDPYLMLGMREAAARVLKAVDAGERILIYGDYDVDGTTGTVVLRRALEVLGAQTGYHVPHRFTEGYGIRRDVLERAQAEGYTLVISVDCGIRAHEPLEWARTNGLDVIVTDHHLPDEDEGAPPAFAVLNPNQRGCAYPDKNLAGVGVAFKLATALLRERGRENLVPGFLKVVAIGTVADVAQLTGENRAIVALGLKDLHRATNPGLRALLEVAGVGDGRGVRAFDLGFRLGPRINAAGRMDAARAVVELFETKDAGEARRLAEHLDARNRERRDVQQQVTERALAEVALGGPGETSVVVVAGEGWHRGVVGLAASKICEKLGRPAVVISLEEDGTGHGSARSTDEFHMLDALTACADLLEAFGGHAHAAGLAVRRENVAELRRRLNENAARLLCETDGVPCLEVDLELPPDALSLELCAELEALEPFGAGWPRPVFVTRGLRVVGEPRVVKERHLKFNVNTRDGRVHDCIWWGGTERTTATPRPGQSIELAYAVEANCWNGHTRLQLVVEDLKAVNREP